MSFDAGAVTARMELDTTEWRKSIDLVKSDSGSMAGAILRNEDAIKNLGKTMTVVGGAIVAAMGVAANSAKKFNEQMAEVATLIPNSAKRVDELKKSVMDMSVSTAKNVGDLTKGLYQVISAFGDTADTTKILEINARAAAAGVATTLDAINLTSAVTKGYGDTSAEAVKKVSDLAFQTVKLGQTTFPELAASIGKVVPIAAALNIKQEELFASMATLTGVTGTAAEVTTQLQSIMMGFTKTTPGMAAAMKQLGYATAETWIEQKGLIGALREAVATTDGTTTGINKLFRRTEGLAAVLALTRKQAEAFDGKLVSMSKSTDAGAEAFNEMANGVNKAGFQMDQAKQKMANAMIKIGDAVLPMISKITSSIAGVIDKISQWGKAHPGLFDALVKLTAVVGGLMAVFGPLLIMLPALTKGWILMAPALGKAAAGLGALTGKVIAFMMSGPGLAALIGVAIITAIKNWNKELDAAIAKMQELAIEDKKNWDIIRNAYANGTPEIIAQIKAKKKELQDSGMAADEVAKKLVAMFDLTKIEAKKVPPVLDKVGDSIREISEAAADAAKTVAESLLDSFKRLTLEEVEYKIWAVNKQYAEQKKTLAAGGADQKTMAMNEKARQLELTKIYQEEAKKRYDANKGMFDKEKQAIDASKSNWIKAMAAIEKQTDKVVKGMAVDWNKLKQVNDKIINDIIQKGKSGFQKFSETLGSWAEKAEKTINAVGNVFNDALNLIAQAFQNTFDRQNQELDLWYAHQQEIIENSTDSEEEKNKKFEELDKEYEAKKEALRVAAAKRQKALAIIGAIINTAMAVSSALATPPFPVGLVMAAIAAVMGAIQIAIISRQPLAKGGLVLPVPGGFPAQIAEAGVPEAVIPLPKLEDMLGTTGGKQRRQVQNVTNIYVSAIDASSFDKFYRSRIVPLIKRDISTERIQFQGG